MKAEEYADILVKINESESKSIKRDNQMMDCLMGTTKAMKNMQDRIDMLEKTVVLLMLDFENFKKKTEESKDTDESSDAFEAFDDIFKKFGFENKEEKK